MQWRDKIQYKWSLAGTVEKLIVVNIAVFILFHLIVLLLYLFGFRTDVAITILREWLVFPSDLAEFIWKPWTIFTYAFMHAGIWHIFFNMLLLFYAGRFFLTFFSEKKLLSYYFLGAITGALLFMLSYNVFPAFAGAGKSHLLGASAGVMAVLVGVAAQAPNMKIRLLLLGDIKLWYIAAFFVVLDVVQMPFGNPGGHLSHIGGALLGYAYTTQLQKGNNIGAFFESFIDWVQSLFLGGSKKQTKSPFSKVYSNKTKSSSSRKSSSFSSSEKQQKIDAILDKISKSGYESLSKEEKEFLFNAGKD